jgi:parallel beta-helix repeat protein
MHGIGAIGAGDTLYIKSGTYTEGLHKIPSGSSWETPVTIAAYPENTVIINGEWEGYVVYIANRHHIVLDGLVLNGIHTSKKVISIDWEAHQIRIQNSEIKNAYESGIFLRHPGPNELINLEIHHNGTSGRGYGIYVESDNNLIEGCTIHHNAGWGIHVYDGHPGQTANNNVIRNNTIYDNGQAQVYANRAPGIGFYTGSGNIAYNNILWGNWFGIAIDYDAVGARIYNNTIYANRIHGIRIGSGGAEGGPPVDTILRNNIVYLNQNIQIQDTGIQTIQDHNLTTDPHFVDAAQHDFRLQPTSPAIDAGITLGDVPDDFDGLSRPRGEGYDIGAYEFAEHSQD